MSLRLHHGKEKKNSHHVPFPYHLTCLLVSFPYNKMPEINHPKGGKVYSGSWSQRFQSIGWLACSKKEQYDEEYITEQSRSPHGSQETKRGGRAKVSTSPSRGLGRRKRKEEELESQHPLQGDTSNDLMPSHLASPLRDSIIFQRTWAYRGHSRYKLQYLGLACDPEKVSFLLLFAFDTGNDNIIIETGVSWISL